MLGLLLSMRSFIYFPKSSYYEAKISLVNHILSKKKSDLTLNLEGTLYFIAFQSNEKKWRMITTIVSYRGM